MFPSWLNEVYVLDYPRSSIIRASPPQHYLG